MNEQIEQTRPEGVLSQMIALANDSQQMQNLLAEALATAVAGSFGITPVGQHTGMTTIHAELLSSMVILLRKAFTTPAQVFGGVSLQDLFNVANGNAKGVGAVYDWLRNRITKSYLPTPELPAPLDSIHMVENLKAGLDGRRISNGGSMPDGISLVRLMSSYRPNVTEIVDDNKYSNNLQAITTWFMNQGSNPFDNIKKVVLNWTNCTTSTYLSTYGKYRGTKVYFPCLETCSSNYIWSYWHTENYANRAAGFAQSEIHLDAFKTKSIAYGNGPAFTMFERIYMPVFESGSIRIMGQTGSAANQYYVNPYTKYIHIGCKGSKTDTIHLYSYETANTVITNIEIGDKENIDKGLTPRWLPCQNLTIQNIDGLTANNMYNRILLRLKQDEAGCGDGVTIALGATNIQTLIDGGYEDKLIELADTYGYTFTDYEQPTAE